MFPWYVGRSKPGDLYDEPAGDTGSSGDGCWDILLLPFYAIFILVFCLLIHLMMFAWIVWQMFQDVYQTTRGTFNTGKLAHPYLTYLGGLIAIIQLYRYVSGGFGAQITSSLTLVLSIGVVIIFTVLPLVALLMRASAGVIAKIIGVFIKVLPEVPQAKPRSCLFVFVGIVIAWGLILAYLDQRCATSVIFYTP
jgi:hypothetical protein